MFTSTILGSAQRLRFVQGLNENKTFTKFVIAKERELKTLRIVKMKALIGDQPL